MGLGEVAANAIGGVIGSLVLAELGGLSTYVSRKLMGYAVDHAPERYRQRLAEEWEAHLNQSSGQISKVVIAAGFVRASLALCVSENKAARRGNIAASGRDWRRAPNIELIAFNFMVTVPEEYYSRFGLSEYAILRAIPRGRFGVKDLKAGSLAVLTYPVKPKGIYGVRVVTSVDAEGFVSFERTFRGKVIEPCHISEIAGIFEDTGISSPILLRFLRATLGRYALQIHDLVIKLKKTWA